MVSATSFSASDCDDDDAGSPAIPRPSHGVPDNEVPVTLAVDQVLGSTEDIVIYISSMSVYTRGVGFTLEVRARPGWRAGDPQGSVWDAIHGHMRTADRLLLGVEFADGRRCANVGGPFNSGSGVSMWSGSSGGGGRAASADWYLTPLPPPGDLRIYCAWPAAGVDETCTRIDAGRILEAAGRARELWPWEPERQEEFKPVDPTLPEGGWFAALSDPGD